MSDKRHVVRVTIVGEEYSIRSDAPPDHTRAVAEYVDQAIKRVMRGANVVETQRAAILAMLQITDELFREREGRGQLNESIASLSTEIRRWLPPSKRGEDELEG